MRKAILAGVAAVMVLGSVGTQARGAAPAFTRLAGDDRYATAVAVSQSGFPAGTPVVYIATGTDFPDALAAVPAATKVSAPILLVTRDTLPDATAGELERLAPDRIVVLGGPGAISSSVVTSLGSYAAEVQRVAGSERAATAAALSAATFEPEPPVAFIAAGSGFADALAGGTIAGIERGPVLLVAADGIPDTTVSELQRLRPASIIVLGGTAAVSTTIEEQLHSFTPGSVTRVGGSDRYQTAVMLASRFSRADTVYLATGAGFADALSVGPLAARANAPVLLTHTSCLPKSVNTELDRLEATNLVLVGGPAALSADLEQRPICIDGSSITFHHDEGVATDELSSFRQWLAASRDDLGDSGPLDFFAYHDLDNLVAAYQRYYPDTDSQTVRSRYAAGAAGESGLGNIFIYMPNFRQQGGNAESIIHEYAHTVQHYERGTPIAECCPGNQVPAAGPIWLIEGEAIYFATTVMTAHDFTPYSFDDIRQTNHQRTRQNTTLLRDYETFDATQAAGGDAWGPVAWTAVEYLVNNSGKDRALHEFWRNQRDGQDWATAFTATFGISPSDFYKTFESYRTTL